MLEKENIKKLGFKRQAREKRRDHTTGTSPSQLATHDICS